MRLAALLAALAALISFQASAQVLGPTPFDSPIVEPLIGRAISERGLFLQSGTGATLQTIETALRRWRAASDYAAGGVCTGSDSTAIQAAITAAGTTGAVLIPPGCVGSYTNPNNISILDFGTTAGNLTIKGKTTLRNADNIRFTSEFSSGSGTGGIAEAYADCPSTGCQIYVDQDITISSAQTISVVSGKDFFLNIGGRDITFTHSSGVGLTIDGGTFRQPFSVYNGSFKGNANSGVTGVLFKNFTGGSVRDILFASWTGTNQIVTQLDFSQDVLFDDIQWLSNTGTGLIALDLTNSSNANAYHDVIFQGNKQAIRIRGSTSGSWFSDCLIQSNTATNAVVIQSTGTDGTVDDTQFHRCWFENNGDGTGNASAVYFNTDAGKTISNASFINNSMYAGANGTNGALFRFSATGTPIKKLTTIGNKFNSFLTITSAMPNATSWISQNDENTVSTGFTPSLAFGPTNFNGFASPSSTIIWAPTGAARWFSMSAGDPVSGSDGNLTIHDWGGAADILAYIGSTSKWQFYKALNLSSTITSYNNISTTAYGIPAIHGATVALTAQTANLAATNVYASAPVGEYRVCANARTTTSGTGTTANLNIIWTDEGGVKTDAVGTWALNSVTVTGQINKCEFIHAAAATAIQVSVTAGTYGTSVYAISAQVERLQ